MQRSIAMGIANALSTKNGWEGSGRSRILAESSPKSCRPSYTDCSLCSRGRLSVAPQNRIRLWNAALVANTGKRMYGRWKIGERVTTPNGFVAEIVGLEDDKALIRYLSTPPGPGNTELPLELLRPATARDLLLAGIKT